MTLLLINSMPQLTIKSLFPFILSRILLFSINASQVLCVGTVENVSTLGISLIYNQISL